MAASANHARFPRARRSFGWLYAGICRSQRNATGDARGRPNARTASRGARIARERRYEASQSMPTLPLPRPRLRRAVPAGGVLLPGEVEVAEPEIIEASGLRWIHIEEPRLAHREWLEKRFKFHALDFEDVYSRNQRPKLDSYDDYIFIVLQFPVFEKATGRLLSAELDIFVGPDYLITLPETPLPPLSAMFDRLGSRRGPPRAELLEGLGLPPVPDRRRQRRRRVPDAPQDGQQARPPRGRHLRGPIERDRPRHLEREAGDHQLPEDRSAPARRAPRPRADEAALPGRRARDLLRRHLRRRRAHLGHPRELQGGRRGAGVNERGSTDATV